MQPTQRPAAWHPTTDPRDCEDPKTCTPARRPGTSAAPSRILQPRPVGRRPGPGAGRRLRHRRAHVDGGLGLDATGVDLAASALRAAEQKARDRGLTARFLRHDALRLADLGESFDTVLDCGLFHIFGGDDRGAYAASLRSVMRPGGRYFMLCFSDAQPPGGWGRVRRVSMDEISTTFADGWRIDSVEPATIDITTDPGGIRAWLAALTRT